VISIDAADLKKSKVMMRLSIKSINTQSADRDAHLKDKDFFNADSIAFAHYEATGIDSVMNGGMDYTYVAHGNLTVRGISKPCDVWFNYNGRTENRNDYTYSFEGSATFNRLDYGIGKESKSLSNEVKVTFNIDTWREAAKK
jgi:polyisoprenoid-binding protein YceI